MLVNFKINTKYGYFISPWIFFPLSTGEVHRKMKIYRNCVFYLKDGEIRKIELEKMELGT